MFRDQHGLEMTAASAEAVARYDRMMLHYLGIRTDTGDRLKEAFDADPEMPMAHCAKGNFMKLFCTPPLERKAEESLEAAKNLIAVGATEREKQHVAALDAWCRGDIAGATETWEAILLYYPTDVLAMRLVHFTHFYLGDSAAMRDSVARSLPYWHADMRHTVSSRASTPSGWRRPAITPKPRRRAVAPSTSMQGIYGPRMPWHT